MFKMIMTAVVALGCSAAFATDAGTPAATTPAATETHTGAPTGDATTPADTAGHDAHAKGKKMAKKGKMDKKAKGAAEAPKDEVPKAQ